MPSLRPGSAAQRSAYRGDQELVARRLDRHVLIVLQHIYLQAHGQQLVMRTPAADVHTPHRNTEHGGPLQRSHALPPARGFCWPHRLSPAPAAAQAPCEGAAHLGGSRKGQANSSLPVHHVDRLVARVQHKGPAAVEHRQLAARPRPPLLAIRRPLRCSRRLRSACGLLLRLLLLRLLGGPREGPAAGRRAWGCRVRLPRRRRRRRAAGAQRPRFSSSALPRGLRTASLGRACAHQLVTSLTSGAASKAGTAGARQPP